MRHDRITPAARNAIDQLSRTNLEAKAVDRLIAAGVPLFDPAELVEWVVAEQVEHVRSLSARSRGGRPPHPPEEAAVIVAALEMEAERGTCPRRQAREVSRRLGLTINKVRKAPAKLDAWARREGAEEFRTVREGLVQRARSILQEVPEQYRSSSGNRGNEPGFPPRLSVQTVVPQTELTDDPQYDPLARTRLRLSR